MKQGEAKTLREWRDSLYMQQTEFAAFLGVSSVATYRAWEQGEHAPRKPTQRAIAAKLGVSPAQVLYWQKEREAVA